MSRVTDIDYLIHRLRISQLRAEDRVAGRMLRFDLDLVELNDYIKTTSTSYPEMRYCSSPDIIPGLPDAPLLAYRQYSAYPPLASSLPRARATPSNSEAIERNGVSAGNSALLRTPLPPGTKTPYEKPGVKDLLLIYSSIKGETSEFLKPSTHPLNPLESAVPSPSNSGNHSSPSASILNSATQVGLDFSPTVTTEFDSTSDIVLTDDNVVRGPQRLSTIPASLIRSPQFSLDSDGDDDDIELDYDEVKRIARNPPSRGKDLLPRHPFERLGTDSLSGSLRSGGLPRKFSQTNLASSPLSMVPGVIYPKSRMRSLSSSSLASSSPLTPLRASVLSHEASSSSKCPQLYSKAGLPHNNSTKSLLSEMIAVKKPVMDNPFLNEFAGVTGQGELAPLALKLYLPHSNDPTVPLSLLVRREATVENVIGFALYTYYDQHRAPPLTPNQSRTSHWTMRIVEEDGTIDEDFPALERSRQIEKFAFDQFALCEVSAAQAKLNELAQTKAHDMKEASPVTSHHLSDSKQAAFPASDSPQLQNAKGPVPITDGQLSIAGGGPSQMIKIQLLDQVGVSHTTTLNVAAATSLNAMKAAVCRKWNLPPEKYDLTSSQAKHALDRNATLEGLLGITELSLISLGHLASTEAVPSQPPVPGEEFIGPFAPAGLPFIYRHYTVYRRMPMFVNNQERVLAIDGYYVHILPPAVRGGSGGGGGFGNHSVGAYASTKSSSYHIESMELCRQGRKIKRRFKLVFSRSHDSKTYDFEATTQEESEEICTNLNHLLNTHHGEKLTLLPLPSN